MIPVQPASSGASFVDHNNRATTRAGFAVDRTFNSAKPIMARRFVVTQLYLVAAMLWMCSIGCQSRIDAIHEQFSDSADQKLSRIDQIIKTVETQGEPTASYVKYRETKMLMDLFSDSDRVNEADLAVLQETLDAQNLSLPSTIEFRETEELPYSNAQCLYLFPGETSLHDSETWSFNTGQDRILPKRSIRKAEKLREAYERFEALEYVLIISPDEIEPPRVSDEDTYELGAIEGVAYLFEIESGTMLGSFRFRATGQNLINNMMWDFTLGEDDDSNLEILSDRLKRDTLRYAEAAAAALSDQVHSDLELQHRPYLPDLVVDSRVEDSSE
ncbi:hypothetical protein AB1L42_09645 [Thalassoglobus sp. JC818]|uniref:hypothetical protein n=1 Tax=Thalassoglobus sp. JC818 TaxID=3232136 RepID=UPI003458FDE0